jgi:hypothetical protein
MLILLLGAGIMQKLLLTLQGTPTVFYHQGCSEEYWEVVGLYQDRRRIVTATNQSQPGMRKREMGSCPSLPFGPKKGSFLLDHTLSAPSQHSSLQPS